MGFSQRVAGRLAPKFPTIPRTLWQTIALINIIPEAASYIIFRDLSAVLIYVYLCAILVIVSYAIEKVSRVGKRR